MESNALLPLTVGRRNWQLYWYEIAPAPFPTIALMVKECHGRRKRTLQGVLISLEQVHNNSPNEHRHEPKRAFVGHNFLLPQNGDYSFADARKQVKEKLLVNDSSLTPHNGRADNACDEGVRVPSLAQQVCQTTLNQLVNEDEEP